METPALDNCLRIVNDHHLLEEDEIERHQKGEINISSEYIRPFRSELNDNLNLKDTKEGKTSVIRHYLFEFRCHASWGNHFDNMANDIFEALMREIKCCCFKYNINFEKIVSEFGIETIHTEDILYLKYSESDEPTDVSILKEPLLWNHPKEHYFTTRKAYEVFKFLCDNYKSKNYNRWSCIYFFMKDNRLEVHLSGRRFLKWVIKYYEPNMKSMNLQEITSKEYEILGLVFNRYQNELE